jgi:hypothetical protein
MVAIRKRARHARRVRWVLELGNFKAPARSLGEPFLLEGLPKGGRGYKEGSLEIERRIRVLFDWLADLHARGRPEGEVPPTGAPVPEVVVEGPAA